MLYQNILQGVCLGAILIYLSDILKDIFKTVSQIKKNEIDENVSYIIRNRVSRRTTKHLILYWIWTFSVDILYIFTLICGIFPLSYFNVLFSIITAISCHLIYIVIREILGRRIDKILDRQNKKPCC